MAKEVVTFDELADFFNANQDDLDMCYKVAARALQINSTGTKSPKALEELFSTPKNLPSDQNLLAFLQGIAETLLGFYNVKPLSGSNVEWLSPAIKAPKPWAPTSFFSQEKALEWSQDDTPEFFKNKNVFTGNGILAAV